MCPSTNTQQRHYQKYEPNFCRYLTHPQSRSLSNTVKDVAEEIRAEIRLLVGARDKTPVCVGLDGSVERHTGYPTIATVVYLPTIGRDLFVGMVADKSGQAFDGAKQMLALESLWSQYGIKAGWVVMDSCSVNITAIPHMEVTVFLCLAHMLNTALKAAYNKEMPEAISMARLFSRLFFKAPTRQRRWLEFQRLWVEKVRSS